MFPSAGYFRSANCPFFLHGLCHRPYCHFRHVKPEYKPTTIPKSTILNEHPEQNDEVCNTQNPKGKIKVDDKKKEKPTQKQETNAQKQDVVSTPIAIFKRTAFEEKLISGGMDEILSESDSDSSETPDKELDKINTKPTKHSNPVTDASSRVSVGKVESGTGSVSVSNKTSGAAECVTEESETVVNKTSVNVANPVSEDSATIAKKASQGIVEFTPEDSAAISDNADKRVAESESANSLPSSESIPLSSKDSTSVVQGGVDRINLANVVESVADGPKEVSDSLESVDGNNLETTDIGDEVKSAQDTVDNVSCDTTFHAAPEATTEVISDETTNKVVSEKGIQPEGNLDILIEDLQKYGKGVEVKVKTKKDAKDKEDNDLKKKTCKPEPPRLTDVNFFSSSAVKSSPSKKKKSQVSDSASANMEDAKKRKVESEGKIAKEKKKSSKSSRDIKNSKGKEKEKKSEKISKEKKQLKSDYDTSGGRNDFVEKQNTTEDEKMSKEKNAKKMKTVRSCETKLHTGKEKSKIQRYKDLKKLVKDSENSLTVGETHRNAVLMNEQNTQLDIEDASSVEIDSNIDEIRGEYEDDSEESELLRIFNDYNPCDDPDIVDITDSCATQVKPKDDFDPGRVVIESTQYRGIKRPSTEKAPVGFKKQRVAHQPNHLIQRAAIPRRSASSTFRRLPRPLQGTLAPPPPAQSTQRQPQQGDRDLVTSTHVRQRVTHFAKPTESTWSARPRIRLEYGAKVPQNVRQKYLDKLVEEYLTLYEDHQEAFDKAEKEEKAIYSKSPRRQGYINVCVNLIKKLRDGGEPSRASDELELGKRNPFVGNSSLPSPTKKLKTDPLFISAPVENRLVENNGNIIAQTRKQNAADELTEEIFYTRLEKYVLTEEELVDNGFPRTSNMPGYAEIKDPYGKVKRNLGDPRRHICCRCGKPFVIFESGEYQNKEECVFHHGRLFRRRTAGEITSSYSCCQGESGCVGCCVAKAHVKEIDWCKESGFMKTTPKRDGPDQKIYALDCEMCYTTKGLELTRVTVVDYKQQLIYDTLVKPDNIILDYNTRFSGITEQSMIGVRTTLREVQAVLLNIIHKDTILMGHSLESDLKSLKLIHSTIVDTAVVFPHRLGPPYKRALRTLMGEFVRKIIQNSEEGHDSLEDAVSCVELMAWKVKEDMKVKGRNKKH